MNQVEQTLRWLIETGETYQAAGKRFGVTRVAISTRVNQSGKKGFPTLYREVKELPRPEGRRGRNRRV